MGTYTVHVQIHVYMHTYTCADTHTYMAEETSDDLSSECRLSEKIKQFLEQIPKVTFSPELLLQSMLVAWRVKLSTTGGESMPSLCLSRYPPATL